MDAMTTFPLIQIRGKTPSWFLLNSFDYAIWALIEDILRRQWSPVCYFFTFFYFSLHSHNLSHLFSLCSCYNLISFLFYSTPHSLHTQTYTRSHTRCTHSELKDLASLICFISPMLLYPYTPFYSEKQKQIKQTSSTIKLCIKWT